jgi:probable HAF family extracellular repeat protein
MATSYTIVDLGPGSRVGASDEPETKAAAINNIGSPGEVAGTIESTTEVAAALWQSQPFGRGDFAHPEFLGFRMRSRRIGTLGLDSSFATCISDTNIRGPAGMIAGFAPTADGFVRAFLHERWPNGSPRMFELGTLIPNPDWEASNRHLGASQAYGITYAFATVVFVVGWSDAPDGSIRAFRWTYWVDLDQPMIDLGTLGGKNSCATGINSKAHIVGWADTEDATHAVLYQNVSRTDAYLRKDLGTLGGRGSTATAISDSRHIVGYSETGAGDEHACRFSFSRPGQNTDIDNRPGRTSRALAVNESGAAVGWARIRYRRPPNRIRYFAFLQEGSDELIDLNNVSHPPTGPHFAPDPVWQLLAATGINDEGVIVGNGRLNGKRRAFLLFPDNA